MARPSVVLRYSLLLLEAIPHVQAVTRQTLCSSDTESTTRKSPSRAFVLNKAAPFSVLVSMQLLNFYATLTT